jgi:uncharacterized protein YmfQ (DUF2313 family)
MPSLAEDLDDAIRSGAESAGELEGHITNAKDKIAGLIPDLGGMGDILEKMATSVGFLGTGFASLAQEIGAGKALAFLFSKTIMDVEDTTTDMVRGFGQTRYFSDAIQSTLIDANVELFELGISIDEAAKGIEGFTSEMGKMNLLTSTEVTRMGVLAKAAGVGTEEIGKMVAEMSDLGMGTSTALESIESLTVQAQNLGLNVNTFINSIGQSIKLVNQYGFDKGVNGLAKMVAKAQALRFDIQQSVNLADTILDGGPEKAVELAAELATLGGDIGELGDPFALMYNSLNDVGAIQDSLVDLASAAATVNEETGQLEIPSQARQKLKEQARLLGLDFGELTDAAINSRKQMMAMEEIEFSGLAGMSDEDKQFIANMSEINEKGEMVVKLKEGDEVREIQLTDEAGITQAMEKLKEQQAEANMDPQDVLKENTKSLISLRDSLDTLTSKEALLKLGAGAFDTQPVQDVIQGLKESVVKVKETLSDTATEIGKKFEDGKIDDEEVKDLINKTTDSLAKNAIDFAEKVGISKTAVESFVTALENAAKTIADIDINNKPGTETQDTAPGTKTMEGKDPEEQDFILRPNQEPISFSKDDIIIGGTDLFGTKSQSNYEPANNLPSIIEKQSSVLDNLYNNVSTSVQKIEQTMAVKDINVNVSGTISVTDRNGNMVDLLRNSDVQNQIVMIVEDAFKRGKDQFV